jgi:hypothetical protein
MPLDMPLFRLMVTLVGVARINKAPFFDAKA